MSHALRASTFPLHGSRLIEASAGTGKTWTIAALYVRLLLQHGDHDTAFTRPLLPSEILVMTFTRAATQELANRIRERLLLTARCFRGEVEPPVGDEFLPALLADYPEAERRRWAAWRLALAAEAMDEAAVFTIDAWCQRMLREHAFDSGVPFDETLVQDEDAVLREAVQDYWREHSYPLTPEALASVLALWPDISSLTRDMRQLVSQHYATMDPAESLADCIARTLELHQQALLQLSQGWTRRAQAMRDWLDEELQSRSAHWDGRKLQARHYQPWLAQLANWAEAPLAQPLDLSASARAKLIPAGLLSARKASAPTLTLPPEFEAFAKLLQAYDDLPAPQTAWRRHAATWVQARLARLKAQARGFGFADMLERLERALAGPQGSALRERIRRQYPVALIDEFQDTSPIQYRLFDALYPIDANEPSTALLLIGDPKQAIYGFRGADIYSYLHARQATATRHYVLDTNYRSTQGVVTVVNAWFEQAERGTEAGAFSFRTMHSDPLPFEPVRAQGRPEVFSDKDGAIPPMILCYDLALRNGTESRQYFAEQCAEQIVRWLNAEDTGFVHPSQKLTRLRPADIAVLVRDRNEAAAMQRALTQRHLAAVYLSDQDSVFASDEARDLLHWLRAVAAPRDVRRVRAALATATLGLTLPELGQLALNDEAFDRRSEQLHELQAVWRDQGVLTMLRRTLHDLDLPARWLDQPFGERRLTNFLHLAELLQQASTTLDGQTALVRWLATQIESPARGSDEQILRLESDADLLKIVTIHKSKGLEYPVVCLPFVCHFRPTRKQPLPALPLVNEDGERRLELEPDEADLEDADKERLREDLRLFYVAMTRARHAVWLGFATIKKGTSTQCQTHRSAPGYLLSGGLAQPAEAWLEPLAALSARCGAALKLLPAAPGPIPRTPYRPMLADSALVAARDYQATFERRWRVGSFSALVRDLAQVRARNRSVQTTIISLADDPSTSNIGLRATNDNFLATDHRHHRADDDDDDDFFVPNREVAQRQWADDLAPAAPWHHFPKGAKVGDFLHEQLEWLADEGFPPVDTGGLATILRRRCERVGLGDHAEALIAWLQAVLDTRLPTLGVTLAQLTRRLPEMEFWLPSDSLHAQDIDQLCRQMWLDDRPCPALPQRELHGMLMGFADLVFEHEGRYWVLDYKSNFLGDGPLNYDGEGLAQAVAHHRYDVQATIYLLALHRLLRARLGEAYDPLEQLGGALYFFVRGIDGPCRGEYTLAIHPESLTLLEKLDHLLTPEEPGP